VCCQAGPSFSQVQLIAKSPEMAPEKSTGAQKSKCGRRMEKNLLSQVSCASKWASQGHNPMLLCGISCERKQGKSDPETAAEASGCEPQPMEPAGESTGVSRPWHLSAVYSTSCLAWMQCTCMLKWSDSALLLSSNRATLRQEVRGR
jgi:hypothetical protein